MSRYHICKCDNNFNLLLRWTAKTKTTLQEIDEEWVSKIKQQKFQWHNSEYLGILASGGDHNMADEMDMAESDEEEDEDEMMYARHGKVGVGLARRDTAGNSRDIVFDDDESDDDEIYGSRLIGGTSALLDGP
jgi:hypothetical protein